MIRQINEIELSSLHLGILVSEFIDKKKCVTFTAAGNSMLPFIKNGDTITIAPYIDDKPEIGDIVAYIDANTGNLVVHRIMRWVGNRFIAKGDNCLHSDAPQFRDRILGYVGNIGGRRSAFFKKAVVVFSSMGCTWFFSNLLKRSGFLK